MMENVLLFVIAAPGATFLALALAWLLGVDLRERTITRLTNAVFSVMILASIWMGLSMYWNSLPEIHWDGGTWFRAAEYAFQLDLNADWLSMPLITLTAVLIGLVGLFSARYMHRESGFVRFFLLLHLFAFGSMLVFAAGSFDLFIGGWELVGISSALLVAFFQQRREPVRSSVHVFSIYRVGDLGLLLGVFVLHYLVGTAEIGRVFSGSWPVTDFDTFDHRRHSDRTSVPVRRRREIRASAVLRMVASRDGRSHAFKRDFLRSCVRSRRSLFASPHLSRTVRRPSAAAAVVAVGLVSAIVGTALHRVVADAKTGIAYAVMTQLGIIFIEIGLGFPKLALAHMLGHAVVRTLQFLRAPSMLHDYHRVHAASGGHLGKTGAHYEHVLPEPVRLWAYRAALDRAFYDAFVIRAVVNPVMAISRWLASFEPGAGSVGTRSRLFSETNLQCSRCRGPRDDFRFPDFDFDGVVRRPFPGNSGQPAEARAQVGPLRQPAVHHRRYDARVFCCFAAVVRGGLGADDCAVLRLVQDRTSPGVDRRYRRGADWRGHAHGCRRYAARRIIHGLDAGGSAPQRHLPLPLLGSERPGSISDASPRTAP